MTSRLAPTLVALAALSAAVVTCAEEPPARAGIHLSAPRTRALTGDVWQGYNVHEQEAAFHLGTEYGIKYCVAVKPDQPEIVRPIEGYIGMPWPASCNWYHSGFLFVILNGRDIGGTPLSSVMVAERDTRAILDLVWHDPLADVRVRFLGLPGSDHLCCEVALEPRQQITSVAVRLVCYPSYFTAWNNRDGARRIQTPTTLVEQGANQTLPARDNWFGVYYDQIFDIAKGEGEGPCAMMLLPDEADQVTFAPGSYAVTTTITYPPAARRLHLAFWDFRGQTNAFALSHIRDNAEALRAELGGLDFTPACVKGFDVAAARAQVQRALASEAAKATLGDKIAQMQTWLDQFAPALEAGATGNTIVAQEQLIKSVDTYYGFMWEVKLAELLGGL